MTHSLPDTLLSQLSEFVTAQMGLYFPRERWRDLERGMGSAAQEFGFKDAESCIPWLVSSPLTKDQIEVLASQLTVGEAYFFREEKSFQILAEHIFPELIRSRRESEQRLRIWSAGCCTGEEPYSIAMLLDRLLPDIKNWRITILATDINPRFLQKASEGVYREWSFRSTPQWIKEKYFTRKKAGHFEILPNLRKMVSFAYLNLAEDAYPSLLNNTNAIDVIFCRNVLMYFTPAHAQKVIQHLYRSLVDGGWLMVSPSEASQVLYAQFVTVNFPDAILYQKPRVGETDAPVPHLTEAIPRSLISDSPTLRFPDSPTRGKVEEHKTAEPQQTPYEEALALYEQGRYAEGAEKLVELFSHDPANSKAIALLARAYANQGKLAEALEWCEKALTADKLNAGYHYLRATILQEQGAVDEAMTSLKRALYLDRNFVLAHFVLGNLMLRQGKFREAKKHFENALALLPAYRQEETLPESEGVTAGRLSEIIVSMTHRKTLA